MKVLLALSAVAVGKLLRGRETSCPPWTIDGTPAPTSLIGNPLIEEAYPCPVSALLGNSDARLPQWADVKPEHIVPAVDFVVKRADVELKVLEANAAPEWSKLVVPFERLTEPVGRAWVMAKHLESVANTPALRKAIDEANPVITQFNQRLSQSEGLYRAFKELRAGGGNLTRAQKRIVDSQVQQFELGGVGLTGQKKTTFNNIGNEMSDLRTKFNSNMLDAANHWRLVVKNRSMIVGLPVVVAKRAADRFNRVRGGNATWNEGPWMLTSGHGDFAAVMTKARSRKLRKVMLQALLSRGLGGKYDNLPVSWRINELRQQDAQILGFGNYTAESFATKMAKPAQVDRLLGQIKDVVKPRSDAEHVELTAFARQLGFNDTLQRWDVNVFASRLMAQKYAVDHRALRQYFALDNVLTGLFNLTERLFDVQVVELSNTSVSTWDAGIRTFAISRNGTVISNFYLDLWSRNGQKTAGAWFRPLRSHSTSMKTQPLGCIVMNKRRPPPQYPVLMANQEVETLFHEFGHALQHLLTTEPEGMAAGCNNVEWDAIEFPSQFLEYFALNDPWTKGQILRHFRTGGAIPANLTAQWEGARHARHASGLLYQLYLGNLDLQLHARSWEKPESLLQFEDHLYESFNSMPPMNGTCKVCSFSHIFQGGYAAGYYSYKWAQVLSADAFAAFQDAGNNTGAVVALGRKYRDTVLAQGGGAHPLDLFVQFRGREPESEPMLKIEGLVA